MTPEVGDAVTVDRHFRFLVRQLVLGVVGLSTFPIWLALGAPGSAFAILTFLWLFAPLAVAAFVLRGGSLRSGQHMETVALTGLVLWVYDRWAVLACAAVCDCAADRPSGGAGALRHTAHSCRGAWHWLLCAVRFGGNCFEFGRIAFWWDRRRSGDLGTGGGRFVAGSSRKGTSIRGKVGATGSLFFLPIRPIINWKSAGCWRPWVSTACRTSAT